MEEILALPYLDNDIDIDKEVRASVEQLILQEMEQGDEYVALPLYQYQTKFVQQELFDQQMLRVQRKIESNEELPQLSFSDDPRVLLEHEYSRLINLQLQKKFGAAQLKVAANFAEKASIARRKQCEDLRDQVEVINKRRKLLHLSTGERLAKLHSEFNHMIGRNISLAKEIQGGQKNE